MTRAFAALCGLTIVLLASRGCPTDAAPVPLALPSLPTPENSVRTTLQNRAFALGFTLQMPVARSQQFLADVKSLQYADPDNGAALTTALLARKAKGLRAAELRSYQATASTLHALGAPSLLLTWADGTVRLLRQPQIVSEEAKPYVKTDPATAAILAEIDEAEAVKVITDQQESALRAWLKLSGGGGALWAQDVGRLAAGMTAASSAGKDFLLPRAAVQRLRLTAPPGTPVTVLRTLTALAPRGKGNLSYLVVPTDVSVPASQVGPAALTLVMSYEAQKLASSLAPDDDPL